MNNKNLTIALYPQGGRTWIAGTIYIHNLIRALALLPETERPRTLLLSGWENRADDHAELGDVCPPFVHHAYQRSTAARIKLGGIRRSFMLGRWPRSLESALEREGVDIVFPAQKSLGRGFPIPFVGWIPDFQHKRLPEYFSTDEAAGRDAVYEKLIAEANHVIVSSLDARTDLMKWFPAPEDRVSAFPFATVGGEDWFEGDPASVATRYGLPDKFLMFPSQFWIHKNHKVLFEAVRILKQRGHPDIALLCTGFGRDFRFPEHYASLQSFIDEAGIRSNLHFPGLLPRHDQVQLLRRAVAIVQPSLFEGWSALVEDCRALGKRLFVSDIPIHREQQPPDATFFNPSSAEELADAIGAEWADAVPGPCPESETIARERGLENAKDYARRFIAIARKVIG